RRAALVLALRHRLAGVEGPPGRDPQVNPVPPGVAAVRLEPSDLEDVCHHLAQVVGCAVDGDEHSMQGLAETSRLVRQYDADGSLDRGQWRPQLVRDPRNELVMHRTHGLFGTLALGAG